MTTQPAPDSAEPNDRPLSPAVSWGVAIAIALSVGVYIALNQAAVGPPLRDLLGALTQ